MELTTSKRVASIDILRGLVMIIMALDHTRDFFHQPALVSNPLNADSTTLPIYFTRWITHFCAPTFLFLSGVSAYLSSLKKNKKEAGIFLMKRGLFLVLLEVTVVSFGIILDYNFSHIVMQVIWAIGWSMVVLGIASLISRQFVLVLGIILFFGHNILDFFILPKSGVDGTILNFLFRANFTILPIAPGHVIGIYYAILPWTGAMLLGYSIGHWFRGDFPASKRKKLLLQSGLCLIVLFIILRVTGVYGNPTPWRKGDGFLYNLFTFLDTSKYPPSLQYLSMTLGPTCIVLALLENVRAKWTQIVSVYGRAPLFYYVLHFYLIHVFLLILFFAHGYGSEDIITPGSPFYFRPLAFGYGLPIVYLIWIVVVALLYQPTKWYSSYKKRSSKSWTNYV
jgi:uncharacterized membrane protein